MSYIKDTVKCNGATLSKGGGIRLCPIRRGCIRYNKLMPVAKGETLLDMKFDFEDYSCENFLTNDYGNYREDT